jgi:4-hydroxybutyrate dehydrogenase
MSYPLGGTYHVPHGEANYAMFTGVLQKYEEKSKGGKLEKLNKFICEIIGCNEEDVYKELENLLNKILMKKPLREYGVKEEEIYGFADSVIENQGRLMANNYIELNRDDLIDIYKKLW